MPEKMLLAHEVNIAACVTLKLNVYSTQRTTRRMFAWIGMNLNVVQEKDFVPSRIQVSSLYIYIFFFSLLFIKKIPNPATAGPACINAKERQVRRAKKKGSKGQRVKPITPT